MATTTQLMTAVELEQQGTPDGLWEVIDGELAAVSPTGGEHNDISISVIFHLSVHVRPRRAGTVLGSDVGIVISENPLIVRSLDADFIRAERFPAEFDLRGFIRVMPDLVVEVRLPGESRRAVMTKEMMWLDAGVTLVWLIDPARQTVTEIAQDRVPHVGTRDDTLAPSNILPGFQLKAADIFAI